MTGQTPGPVIHTESEMTMPIPTIEHGNRLTLREATDAFQELVPEGGKMQLHEGKPHEISPWHRHPATETLIILEGWMRFSWIDHAAESTARWREIGPGSMIHLPVNAVVKWSCLAEGCCYLRIPGTGRAPAETPAKIAHVPATPAPRNGIEYKKRASIALSIRRC